MKTIDQLLLSEPRGILSLTGGGGKTSLMFHLARLLTRSGRTVLTTTTTKIYAPTAEQSETVIIDVDPEAVLRKVSLLRPPACHVTAAAARVEDSGKLKGFDPEAIRTFENSGLFDWILVEADGSARRPLKAPAGHEPVVPPGTTVLVAVAGLEVLGRPLNEELVFRCALAAEAMNLSEGDVITEPALAALFAHPRGAFKNAPPKARRVIFLNKADDPERIGRGARVAEELRRSAHPAADLLIVGQALEEIVVHAEYSLTKQP